MLKGSRPEGPLVEPEGKFERQEKKPEALPAKPVTGYGVTGLTRLPRLTPLRRFYRWLVNVLSRLAVRLCTRLSLEGLENFPAQGPAVVVTNHLGDADAILAAGYFPTQVEGLAKIDLVKEYPLIGWIMDAYGVIWVHRGQPDRAALQASLQVLRQGRILAIAPEGRESLSGSLEEGTGGAAYLALKAGCPIVPVVFMGTENAAIFGNLKRLHRAQITLRVGQPFTLPVPSWKAGETGSGPGQTGGTDLSEKGAIRQGTHAIMLSLAKLLPANYRGVYQNEIE